MHSPFFVGVFKGRHMGLPLRCICGTGGTLWTAPPTELKDW
jgi:hypothetical protein